MSSEKMKVTLADNEGVILTVSGESLSLSWAEWFRLVEMVEQSHEKVVLSGDPRYIC